jgi:DNA-binding winged helix-turn-helix (wHTH) protein/tetratricopeptide (TPR) repeat protein
MRQGNSALPGSEKPGLSFASFSLEDDGTLLRGETPVHLPPKELAALRLLLANAGSIVTPARLRQALWGDVHVTADSVPKCVSSLRARLEPEDCIQTVYKRGYRLTATVRTRGSGPGGALPRLAILPFASGYGVPDHLGSFIAEETMARLSSSWPAAVSVLAQDSVFTLARRGLTALETGEALKADVALAGSIRALPTHYRLRAEMIRVGDGTQLWVEDLLVERTRIAGLETELADRLAFRLNSGAPMDSRLPREPITASGVRDRSSSSARQHKGLSIAAVADPEVEKSNQQREAYETFQRAHHEWQTLERHRMQDGLQHLLRVTELDPSLIEARIDLVNLCVAQGIYGYMSPAVAADIVRRTAQSGLQAPGSDRLPGESATDGVTRAESILPALGWVQFHVDRDLPAALSAFSLSSHLPHNQWMTRVRSMFALSRHRFGEAIDLLRAAIELDPFSPWLQARLAWTLHLASGASGNPSASPNASIDQIRRTLEHFPEDEAANLYGATILAFNGEAAQATDLAQKLAERLPYFDLATEVHAYALACAGRGDEARTILERLQWLGRERFLLRAFMPAVYVALGEPDAALAELHTSEQIRCPWFFQMLADPRLKPLHSRTEFVEMQAILTGMEAARDTEDSSEAAGEY